MEAWHAWLTRVWACEPVAEAIEVASPVLARRVAQVYDGRRLGERQVRRLVVSVVRYLLRMTARATPFGLFAGVAPARIGTTPDVRWGCDDRAVARADAVWLADVVTRLEQCAELLRRVPVVRNNLAFVRGGRLVVPCQEHADESGQGAPAEVSVRHTRAVELVTRTARSPILVADLIGALTADFPDAAESVIAGLVGELVSRRMLLSSLRAPMTQTDPLGHLIDQLTAAEAEALPQIARQVRDLREIHGLFARHNRSSSRTERRSIRAAATERMAAVSDTVTQPVAVDLRLDCIVELPECVAREAEVAASVLTRLTPYPSGSPTWRDYYARFCERYGPGALVPVAELVHADTGLGFPAGYRDSLLDLPARGVTGRDERLLALAQDRAIDGGEIVLDEQTVTELTGDNVSTRPVPHTALCFQVHAKSRAALEHGEFELALVGAPRGAATTTGRFLYLFDAPDRGRVARAYAALPTVEGGALVGQVSCPPLYPRAANVARAPAVLPWSIPLAEYPARAEQVLRLDDLAVSATADRLHLVSLSRRCAVEPAMVNALELRDHTQPIARFLTEIATSHAAACVPFWWGAASRLPFLPRVRYRRTVLSPACWRLLASPDLPGPGAPWPVWTDSLTRWRRKWHVPDTIYLGEGDERIRLDLTEDTHRALLRAELDRTGNATVCEAPDDTAYGWLGRAHEIVVPLASTVPPRHTQPSSSRRLTGSADGHLPGCSRWLFAKLYGHPDRQDDILTVHLPDLLAGWESPPQWWFLRYRDPQPHLRVRFHLTDPDAFGTVAAKIGAWAADLRRHGLVSRLQFDTYQPETGRFGDGPAMAAAEAVFAADSAAALAQIACATATGGPHPYALAAASLVDLVAGFTGSTPAGMAWLVDTVTAHCPPRPPGREVHRQAMRLADPCEDGAAVRALPGGSQIARAWAGRRAALAAYRAELADPGEWDQVLGSLLHLHHIRAVGLDPDSEAAVHRLARAAALAWTARKRP